MTMFGETESMDSNGMWKESHREAGAGAARPMDPHGGWTGSERGAGAWNAGVGTEPLKCSPWNAGVGTEPLKCSICNTRSGGEQIPFSTACKFCLAQPSFHHGRCCPQNPYKNKDRGPPGLYERGPDPGWQKIQEILGEVKLPKWDSLRVVLKYYLNNSLQLLFNENPKILSSKITYELT